MWDGPECGETQRALSAQTIEAYARYAAEQRGRAVPVVRLSEYPVEPLEFTRHFHAWNVKQSVRNNSSLSLGVFCMSYLSCRSFWILVSVPF